MHGRDSVIGFHILNLAVRLGNMQIINGNLVTLINKSYRIFNFCKGFSFFEARRIADL